MLSFSILGLRFFIGVRATSSVVICDGLRRVCRKYMIIYINIYTAEIAQLYLNICNNSFGLLGISI